MPEIKFIVVGAIIIGAIAFLMFSGINDSMIYYFSVPEVLAKASEIQNQGIRVSGHVADGSIELEPGESRVRFLVIDKNTEKTMPVVYQGIIPDTFKDHAEVVVEGRYSTSDGVFQANTLLAKCPSKYESQEEGESSYGTSEYSEAAGAQSQ